jgi:anti-anti-sigma factor
VVDLNDVPFIDSSGLAALISGLKAARTAGGDLRIARPSDQARMLFELTRLDKVLLAYPSVEDAVANY